MLLAAAVHSLRRPVVGGEGGTEASVCCAVGVVVVCIVVVGVVVGFGVVVVDVVVVDVVVDDGVAVDGRAVVGVEGSIFSWC